MFRCFLNTCLFLLYLDWGSQGALILPGAELPPSKYMIDLYVVCDFYCYENIGTMKSDREGFLYDVIYHASRILSQLDVALEVVGMEIWSSYGFTNWTSSSVRPEYFYDVIDGMMDGERKKSTPYFDDLLFFTGMGLTTGNISSPWNIRAIHTTATIGRIGSKGILTVNKFQSSELLSLTLAHEIGHGLNMLHDTPDCSCPSGLSSCVMESVSTTSMLSNPKFSKCSTDRFNSWISTFNKIPLNKKFAPTSSQMGRNDTCGNGNVDAEEECDCGPDCAAQGTNTCCRNCKFQTGALCVGGPCCTGNCKFKTSGTKCRSSRSATCDQEDVCSGTSADCEDKQAAEWTDCNDDAGESGYCKEGYCNTVNVQCQTAFNSDYQNSIETCFNSTNLPAGIHIRTDLSLSCQLLMCNKNNNNNRQAIHPDRKPQTFISSGKQCTIGRYLPVEIGLLGMTDGWMEVEDGTKCGLSSACFKGKCLALEDVKTAMVSCAPSQRKGSLCGNGKLDAGEDCDCSPLQCPCCNTTSCKFIPANIPCFGVCGVCSASSKECSESPNPVSNFRQCSGSFEKLCYGGRCISLLKQCQEHYFPWSRDMFQYSLKNVGAKSKFFNSGGFFIVDSANVVLSEFYSEGEGDGQCGILHCSVATPDDQANDWDMVTDPRQVFTVEVVNTGWMKVKYYNKANRTMNGRLQRIFHPLLVEDGTPCFLSNNALGYCKTETLINNNGVSFPCSKCIQL